MNEKQFNKLFPIGTPVKYHPVIGQPEFWETETRSSAWTLASGHVVVQVKGRSGCVAIAAIERGTTTRAVDLLDSSEKSALVAQPANH